MPQNQLKCLFEFLGCVMRICCPALLTVTPIDYQPPGFKEGVCDSLWFKGMAVHFKVGDVQTAFHTLKVRVSAEQGRVDKLQKGSHLRETKQVSPEREMMEVGPVRRLCDEVHVFFFFFSSLNKY